MPPKKDQDTTAGTKLLKLFRKLMLDGRQHYQTDLAEELQCSPQTIIRLIAEIESVIGISLESGLENRKRWYQIRSISRSRLGLEFEEIRYLSICRDLASAVLPQEIFARVDETIFNLSLLMSEQGYGQRELVQKQQYAFFAKGKIDYSKHIDLINKLVDCIDEKRICLIMHKAGGKNEIKEHRFLPTKIISLNNALYVLGVSLTQDFKEIKYYTHFAIHRMKDIVITERKSSFEIEAVSPDAFGLPWHEPKQFCIYFSAGKIADYVRERIFAEQQNIVENEDGSLVLEIISHSEPEILAFVRSFGEGAKLL